MPVQAGTDNINTNTHTESFVDQHYQTTVTNFATYLLNGTLPASLPPLAVSGAGGPGAGASVSGTNCTKAEFGGSASTGGSVVVTIGFPTPLVLHTTAAGGSGAWSVSFTVPPGTPNGVYPVNAVCNDPVPYPTSALTVQSAAVAVVAQPATAG